MARYGSFGRSGAACASLLILGLLMYPQDARSQAAVPDGPGQFEQASVAVPAGSQCMLHPEGPQDPTQSLQVNADEDGVARFLAVRPTQPNSVNRLALDCTESSGRAKTYAVDLRSEATFAAHPFDPSRTTLAVRPALTGDPGRFTQAELIQAGYGLRPDQTENPDVYRAWLAQASIPVQRLRTDRALAPSPSRPAPYPELSAPSPALGATVSHRSSSLWTGAALQGFFPPFSATIDQSPPTAWTGAAPQGSSPVLDAKVYTSPSNYWTGAVLQGSYHVGATFASTYSYGSIFAQVVVPKLTRGPTAAMTIWGGLDNVCQAIIDVNTTATTASFGIHHQCFHPHIGHTDTAGVRFTPRSGDVINLSVWYCDAKGNQNLSGGYACTNMVDVTQHAQWYCAQANSSDCPSYKFESCQAAKKPQALCNIGRQAEFIIEDDSKNSGEWPIFSPVTMRGSAKVVKGNGGFGPSQYVGTTTDPKTVLLTDNTHSTRRLLITLPPLAVKWSETTCTAKQTWNPNSGACVSK